MARLSLILRENNFYYIIMTILGVIIFARIGIYLLLNFPAPIGDSPLFASVSQYYCSEFQFRTPIGLDETNGRYTWHGILQPAIISMLSYECSIAGLYGALSIVILFTVLLCIIIAKNFSNKYLIISFIALVFSLQSRQTFRPETLAITLMLVSEFLIFKKNKFFIIFMSLLGWTHPVSFIIYTIWALLFHIKFFSSFKLTNYKFVILALFFVNILILLLYPYSLEEHLFGLALQGKKVAGASWGSYYSDVLIVPFFPFFGIVFFAVFASLLTKNYRIIFLVIPIWWFWLRVPALLYNVMPLLAVMFLQLLMNYDLLIGGCSQKYKYMQVSKLLINSAIFFSSLCSILGLMQGISRDLISYYKYNSTYESSLSIYNNLIRNGLVICNVPAFFTLLLPSQAFVNSWKPTLAQCNSSDVDNKVNLYQSSGSAGNTALNCERSHSERKFPVLNNFFKSDSGYSYLICH